MSRPRDNDPVSNLKWHPSPTADQNACRENKSAAKHYMECSAQERRFHVAVLYESDGPQLYKNDNESNDGCGPERRDQVRQGMPKAADVGRPGRGDRPSFSYHAGNCGN
jgi:hypothetical protein